MTSFKTAGRPARWAVTAAALLMLSGLCACAGRHAAGAVVAGSTSVQPYVEVLAEEYALLHPDHIVDIQGGGSSAGITAAQTGTADIGMSSRALNPQEQHLWSAEIAKDGLAVIVHPDNPLQGLTTTQVRDIYAAVLTHWDELGGNTAKIHIISREEGSGTRSAFEELLMADAQISPKAIVQDSNGAVRQLVSDDVNAVGFISLGLVNDSVKALPLDGVPPTMDHVLRGDYHLFRPFLFVAAAPPTGLAKQFLDYTLSPVGQEILAHEGLIPTTEGLAE